MKTLPVAALLLTFAACEKGGGTQVEDPGSVQLTIATTGRVLDRDGYTVSVDGGTAVAVPSNGSATLSGLTPGAHTLTIAGVDPNCTVTGTGTRSVTVQSNAATPLEIAVQCVANRFAYYAGLGAAIGMGLMVAKVDGTEVVELKRGVRLGRLAWKPDGYSLLYVRLKSGLGGSLDTSIWSVDVITRDSVLVVGPTGMNVDPQWSPTGDRIAFAFSPEGFSVPARVIIMNADGSGRRGVTGYTGNGSESMPTWSPDGNQLAYRRGPELRIVNADGTGDRLVTDLGTEDYTQIAWSPDGAWLVWDPWALATKSRDLYRVRPDGSGRAAITATEGMWEETPSFLADGRILFTATPQGQPVSDPWAIAVDGSGRVNLLTTPQVGEIGPAWQ